MGENGFLSEDRHNELLANDSLPLNYSCVIPDIDSCKLPFGTSFLRLEYRMGADLFNTNLKDKFLRRVIFALVKTMLNPM